MIRLRIFFIIVCMLPLTTMGQTYHDANNEQIVGHAKELTYSRSATLETYLFDRDGRIHQKDISNAHYDEQGWMQSCTIIYMGHPTKMAINYDVYHRISSQKLQLENSYILEEYAYADGVCPLVYTMTICYNGLKQSISTTYSDYQFDARGNWISRAVTTGSYTSYETRNILYWE